MALLHRLAHVLHHRTREALCDRGQQRLVLAQTHGQRPYEPDWDRLLGVRDGTTTGAADDGHDGDLSSRLQRATRELLPKSLSS